MTNWSFLLRIFFINGKVVTIAYVHKKKCLIQAWLCQVMVKYSAWCLMMTIAVATEYLCTNGNVVTIAYVHKKRCWIQAWLYQVMVKYAA